MFEHKTLIASSIPYPKDKGFDLVLTDIKRSELE
jgi:hypothetical protein